MRPTRSPIDWNTYVEDFHTSFPGITEDVLARCTSDGLSPYRWLTQQIDDEARVLDLGCGSGPARPPNATRWVGLDRSQRELERAAELGRTALLRGNITQLPLAARSVDVVTSSMAMMLVQPIDVALVEVDRVLRDGGELRLLLPATAPLTMLDRIEYLRLFWAARSTAQFPPTTMGTSARDTLEASGFTVVADERVRFDLPLDNAADAERFINSWYLPSTTDARRGAARGRASSMAPFRIGIPLRRIIAAITSGRRS